MAGAWVGRQDVMGGGPGATPEENDRGYDAAFRFLGVVALLPVRRATAATAATAATSTTTTLCAAAAAAAQGRLPATKCC